MLTRHAIYWTLLFTGVFSLHAPPSAAAAGRHLAVIVGVNDYDDGRIPDLNFCVKDVEEIQKRLTQYCGYDSANVLVMHDKLDRKVRHRWPEKDNLEEQIKTWLALAGADDTVLFFFSGHGFLHQQDGGEPVGFLAPQDVDPERLEETGLRTRDVKDWLLKCKAKRKFLILDCCHAGASKGIHDPSQPLGKELGGKQLDVNALPKAVGGIETAIEVSEGLVVLASCTESETSAEWRDEEQGLFTYFLARGLSGAADLDQDGIVNHLELFQYVVAKVTGTAQLELNTRQTPVMFHHEQAKGLFKLATVARPVPVGPLYIPQASTPGTLELAANDEAKAAFERLQGSKDLSPDSRKKDAQILLDEALRLRFARREKLDEPSQARAAALRTNPFESPYGNPERARDIFNWMQAAQAELKDAVPTSLRVSLALAAWDKPEQDLRVAEEQLEALRDQFPFDKSEETKAAQARLLLMYAATRENSPAGRLTALSCFAKTFDLIEEHERLSRQQLRPDLVNQRLIEPAKQLVAAISAGASGDKLSAETKQAIARVYGAQGDLICNHGFFQQNDQALEAYENAIKWDDGRVEYYVGLGSIHLQEEQPRYEVVREQARKALALVEGSSKVGDMVEGAVAYRLEGDAWMRESREEADFDSRLEQIRRAVDCYTKSISKFESLPANSLTMLDQRHFGDSYLSRSAAHLELANFNNSSSADRVTLLEKAQSDAKLATGADQSRGYQAFTAIGNALEDRAWLGKFTESFQEADEAFEKAKRLRYEDPKPWINLARCRYKREVFGGQRGWLQRAKEDLEFSVNLEPLPEAHYWLAQIHAQNHEHVAAIAEMQTAIDLIDSSTSRITHYDRKHYFKTAADIAIASADDLLRKLPLSGGGDVTAVHAQLRQAETFAQKLAGLHPVSHAVTMAKIYERDAKLIPSATSKVAKLRQVLQLYDSALRQPRSALTPVERVTILCRCSEICLTYALADSASKKSMLEQSLKRVDAAVATAHAENLPLNEGEALYLAGMIRLQAAISGAFTTAEAARLRGESLDKLRRAAGVAKDHPRCWEWSNWLAKLLLAEAKRARTSGSQSQFEALKSEGVKAIAFADANCPDLVARPAIQQTHREFSRLTYR